MNPWLNIKQLKYDSQIKKKKKKKKKSTANNAYTCNVRQNSSDFLSNKS